MVINKLKMIVEYQGLEVLPAGYCRNPSRFLSMFIARILLAKVGWSDEKKTDS
jgi:hypothetical protein